MKILSFFSRATIVLFLQICFVTTLTVSFCEPVFAAKLSKKKKKKKKKKKGKKKGKKKKSNKKKSKKKKEAKKKEAKRKEAEKKAAEKKAEEKKVEPKPAPNPALIRFQTENTYWCGSVYCDKAQDDDDAACLLSPGNKPMQCIYGNLKAVPRDQSLKELKVKPEDGTGMEMCLYELRALCGGFSASFNKDKDLVSAECEKNDKMYKCLQAFENVPGKTNTSGSKPLFSAAGASSTSPVPPPPVLAGSPGANNMARPVISKNSKPVPAIPGTSFTPPEKTVE